MPNMTLSIPEDLHRRMKALPFISWSEVARQAIAERALTYEEVEKIAQKSKLTQKDADEIAKKVKRGIARRFMSMK